MFRYDLKGKNPSDPITHSVKSEDPNFQMKIPKNWGYENGNYEIIKTDITKEFDHAEALKNRRKEYPDLGKCIMALIKHVSYNKPEDLSAIKQKIDEVDLKYPLPKKP